MFFDPMYFLFILRGLGLSLWVSARVKRAFNKYSKVRSRRYCLCALPRTSVGNGSGGERLLATIMLDRFY